MTIALSLLALLAIAAAVGAASRVQRQLAVQAPQTEETQDQLTGTRQESPEAQRPRKEVDQDRNQTRPSSSRAELAIADPSKGFSEPSLAASLTVTEVLHPSEVDVSIHHSHNTSEESLETVPAVNLLDEIEALDHSDHHGQITHLSRYIKHSDSVMRSAAVFALGELLAKCDRAEMEEISALLHQFSQDPNSQVRLQSATALGKMQLS
jgi:HEAT repeats